ncbi:MAG: DUF177 domain-containing protein [Azospirillaceae bacterium]|nr:DUF177 domain-containing protein [Azospirillaceae bacterium]
MTQEPAVVAAGPAIPAEFSRRVIADTISTNGLVQKIVATPAECAALARRFDLPAIHHLEASVTLRRIRDVMIAVDGHVTADLVQSCVVTLEPVPAHIDEHFTALFAPAHLITDTEPELVYDPDAADEDEWPEPLESGGVDIGEVTAQHLSLALDPYPRKPGAAIATAVEEPVVAPVRTLATAARLTRRR